MKSPLFWYVILGLLLNRCSNGAGISAVAAADALVSVDNIDIAFGNARNRALRSASTASDAIFSDLVCHLYVPPYRIMTNTILPYLQKKSRGF